MYISISVIFVTLYIYVISTNYQTFLNQSFDIYWNKTQHLLRISGKRVSFQFQCTKDFNSKGLFFETRILFGLKWVIFGSRCFTVKVYFETPNKTSAALILILWRTLTQECCVILVYIKFLRFWNTLSPAVSERHFINKNVLLRTCYPSFDRNRLSNWHTLNHCEQQCTNIRFFGWKNMSHSIHTMCD